MINPSSGSPRPWAASKTARRRRRRIMSSGDASIAGRPHAMRRSTESQCTLRFMRTKTSDSHHSMHAARVLAAAAPRDRRASTSGCRSRSAPSASASSSRSAQHAGQTPCMYGFHACQTISDLHQRLLAIRHICRHCLQPNRYKEHLQNKHGEEVAADGSGGNAAAPEQVCCSACMAYN